MRKSLKLSAIAAVMAAAPVTFSPAEGFKANDACADGTCCPETGSICGLNGQNYNDKYWTGAGPCPTEPIKAE